nr:abortive infection family protein [Halomonas zhaodongensis]
MLIATLRNRLSSSHGAGAQAKVVPEHVATYAVNATASAILFLYSEFQ